MAVDGNGSARRTDPETTDVMLDQVPRRGDPYPGGRPDVMLVIHESSSLREVQAIEAVFRALDAIDDDPQMQGRVITCAVRKYRIDPEKQRLGVSR